MSFMPLHNLMAVTPSVPLRVLSAREKRDAERRWLRSHAERGNDKKEALQRARLSLETRRVDAREEGLG